MKIKTKKKLNVLELAQAVKEGEVERGIYTSVGNEIDVYFGSKYLDFECTRGNAVTYRDTFEVETLEELTEDTPLPCRVFVTSLSQNDSNVIVPYAFSGASYGSGKTIKTLKSNKKRKGYAIKQVFVADGYLIGQLIWSKENGFADGVLEVSE